MKRFLYIIKTFFISPEFTFLAVTSLLVFLYPEIFIWLSTRINTTSEIVKYLYVLPAGITVYMVTQKRELLSPEPEKASESLLKWPDYHKISDSFWICITYGGLGTFFCFSTALFGDLKDYRMLVVFLSGIVISIITVLTFINAAIVIKKIIAEFQN